LGSEDVGGGSESRTARDGSGVGEILRAVDEGDSCGGDSISKGLWQKRMRQCNTCMNEMGSGGECGDW